MNFSYLDGIRSIGIVGATGLAGAEFLNLLIENKISIPDVRVFGSERSAGETIEYGEESLVVEELNEKSLAGLEVVFFSTPTEVSLKYIPKAIENGSLVIDDSTAFRLEKNVPLIVPQVNGELLREYAGKIISTPNCVATPLAVCLKPLQDKYGIKRVVVSTYQSVSGAGRKAYQELAEQSIALLNGENHECEVFPHRISFNLLPLIGSVDEEGISEEEAKVQMELRKILSLPSLKTSVTAVRVPTFFGHGCAVNVELEEDFESVESLREVLDKTPGCKVIDKPVSHVYPTNVEAVGSDPVFIGRVRRDFSVSSGINFWVVSDNLRKGAALNALESLDAWYRYRKMV
jgi:aspartate-semialdehyde dehydrogenase